MENKVTLIGDIVDIGDYKTLGNGVQVCNFTVRTWGRYNDKVYFEYHPVTLWGIDSLTRAKSLLKVGQLVKIDGSLVHHVWQDRNNHRHRKTAVRCTMLREAKMDVPILPDSEREKYTLIDQRKLFGDE